MGVRHRHPDHNAMVPAPMEAMFSLDGGRSVFQDCAGLILFQVIMHDGRIWPAEGTDGDGRTG